MVRHKNVISTIMQSYVAMGVISMLWVFVRCVIPILYLGVRQVRECWAPACLIS